MAHFAETDDIVTLGEHVSGDAGDPDVHES